MNPIHTSVRTLVLCTLVLPGCLPGSLSLGETDTDTDTGSSDDATNDPASDASVRWSTIRTDINGDDVAIAPDGSIYVVGQAGFTPQGDGGTYDDFWLAKYSAEGALVWETFEPLTEESYVYPEGLAVDGAGDVYLATIDYSAAAGYGNRVRKLDPAGNELWSVEMPGRPFDIAALPGGGAIVVGAQESLAWVQRIDADGTLGWSRNYGDGGMRYSAIEHAAVTGDGGVVLGGRMGLEPASSRAYAWSAALDVADGAERWQAPVSEGTTTEWIMGLGVAADGTSIMAVHVEPRRIEALGPDGASAWSWDGDVPTGTSMLTAFPDAGFALGGRRELPVDDPNLCTDVESCPTEMWLARLEPDRSYRWSFATTECGGTLAVVPTADGGLLALAGCGSAGEVGVGLFQFDP